MQSMMYGQFKGYNPNVPGTRANAYATGNRVYNGTNPSPQVGQGSVNPVGYANRDNQAAVRRQLLLNMARGYGGMSNGR